jgi:hypothetical protein
MKDNEVLSYKLKSPYDILARTPKNANIEILLGLWDEVGTTLMSLGGSKFTLST